MHRSRHAVEGIALAAIALGGGVWVGLYLIWWVR